MTLESLTSRVARLEAHREDMINDLSEIKTDVKELIAAHNRFRGAVKVALMLSGAVGLVIGYFAPKTLGGS
tara:strand:+ start:1026 stop:1238 length:213 start_codon:yes stop_codon:yes gene_type:complete